MNRIFGRASQPVLALIIRIADLSSAEVDQVTKAWKQVSAVDRALAWARLTGATTEQERYWIPAAASRPSAAPDGLGVLRRRERRHGGRGCRHPNRSSLRNPDCPANGGYARTGPTARRPHGRVRQT